MDFPLNFGCRARLEDSAQVFTRAEAVEQIARDLRPGQQGVDQQEDGHRQLDAPVVGDGLSSTLVRRMQSDTRETASARLPS